MNITPKLHRVKLITPQEMVKIYKQHKSSHFQVFWDLETLVFNKKAKKPSERKSIEYFSGFGFIHGTTVYVSAVSSITSMFNTLKQMYNETHHRHGLSLLSLNGNRYDNHFIFSALKKEGVFTAPLFPKVKIEQFIDDNNLTYGDDFLACSRVRTSTNLELQGVYKGVPFITKDLFPLTQLSVASMGRMLVKNNILKKGKLVGQLKYDVFDRDEDLKYPEEYRDHVFSYLNKDQIEYGVYDIAIIALFYKYYPYFYPGFKRTAKTLIVNVMDAYINEKNRRFFTFKNKKMSKQRFRFRDFWVSNNMNLYYYLRLAFHGGLNFYNDRKVGEVLTGDFFSIDENSAYSAAMYNALYPGKILGVYHNKKIDVESITPDHFHLISMTYYTFNSMVATLPELIAKMCVKYLNSNGNYIVLSTYHIALMKEFGLKGEYDFVDMMVFDTIQFPAKETLADFYRLKTQGKCDVVLNMDDVSNIEETTTPHEANIDENVIYVSKVNMNGFYGGLALRQYFDYFEMTDDGEMKKFPNLVMNSERNILYAIQITAYNFYNLILPLASIPPQELYDLFLYCDTDSLYLDKRAYKYIENSTPFSRYNLGGWDIENFNIKKFLIFNHKKYCYEDEKNGFVIHAGGVNKNSTNNISSVEECYLSLFQEGKEIEVLRSVINVDHSITLYNTTMTMAMGGRYNVLARTVNIDGTEYNNLEVEEGGYIDTGNLQLPSHNIDNPPGEENIHDFIIEYNYYLFDNE